MRLGCAPDITSGARSVSPLASVTPVTRPPVDVDRGDRRAGADRRPGGARAGGDRLGDRAHAAAHVAPGALHAVDLAERVVQQVVGGARRVGPGPDADDAARGVGALELVGLEVVVEQVADRHRHEPEDVGQVAAAHARRATGLAQQLEDVAGPLGARRRRRAQHQRLEEERRLLEQRVERRQRVGVLARDARDLLVGDLARRWAAASGARRRRRSRTRGRAGSGHSRTSSARGRRRPSAGASRPRRRRARRAGRATAPRSRRRRRGCRAPRGRTRAGRRAPGRRRR